MTKRSLDEVLKSLPSSDRERKRPKQSVTSDELADILRKCEDLLQSISSLGSLRSSVAAEVKHELQADDLGWRTREALHLLDVRLSADSHRTEISGNGQPVSHDDGPVVASERHARPGQSPDAALSGSSSSEGLEVPSMARVTKYRSTDIDQKPPLLPVLDPALEQLALTHKGHKGNAQPGHDYERLEWLGDAYIHIISTLLVYQTFPAHNPGRLSQLRELLLRNSTLAQFTTEYGLNQRANLPQELLKEGISGGAAAREKVRQKVYGDIFEAYLAATIESDPQNGLAKACDWIKDLWRPFIAHHIRPEEVRAGKEATERQEGGASAGSVAGPDPKSQLVSAIGAPGVTIWYEELPSRKKTDRDNPKIPLFTIGVFMNGWGEKNKLLGQGSALSKSNARIIAARNALEKKTMISLYAKKKEILQAANAAAARGVLPVATAKLEVGGSTKPAP